MKTNGYVYAVDASVLDWLVGWRDLRTVLDITVKKKKAASLWLRSSPCPCHSLTFCDQAVTLDETYMNILLISKKLNVWFADTRIELFASCHNVYARESCMK
jgi:hypothetical protein